MKRYHSFFGFSVLLLMITSCDVVKGSSPISDNLAGTWNWERTTVGFIGEILDADFVSYRQKLVVNDEAEAFLYRDNELIMSYNIRFEKLERLEQRTWVFHSKKESPVLSYVTTFKDGKLVLRNDCGDCYTLHFKKVL